MYDNWTRPALAQRRPSSRRAAPTTGSASATGTSTSSHASTTAPTTPACVSLAARVRRVPRQRQLTNLPTRPQTNGKARSRSTANTPASSRPRPRRLSRRRPRPKCQPRRPPARIRTRSLPPPPGQAPRELPRARPPLLPRRIMPPLTSSITLAACSQLLPPLLPLSSRHVYGEHVGYGGGKGVYRGQMRLNKGKHVQAFCYFYFTFLG